MIDGRHGAWTSASAALAVIPALTLSGAQALVAQDLPAARSSRPSVLLITLDTVRADHVGCYGYSKIETPNLDRLASDGIRFSHAYAQVPITLASHAVILTGTYPMSNRVRDFTSAGLAAGVPTLAERLRRNGYRTAAFVSSFVLNSMWGLRRGFEVYDDNVALDVGAAQNPFLLVRSGDATVDRLLDWTKHSGGEPFFVWLHLYDAHSPYRSPEPYRSLYSVRPYDGAIAFDDAQVGRVLARLRALNLYDSALIAVLSDHGESLGEHGESEHGFFVYNATLRVPLILKLPGETARARAVSRPVETVDVAPTIAQICKLRPSDSEGFQGQSLLRQIGEAPAAREEGYAESYYPRDSFGWHELRALVTPEFKYIEAPRPELYDLLRDPGERSNIIDTHSALASSLGDRLSEFGRRFAARAAASAAASPDPEVLEKLKSLGYLGYKAPTADTVPDIQRANPKDKIATLNRILRAADLTRLGKYAQADLVLNRLEQTEPRLYVVPFEKGENYLAWGRPEAALGEFKKSLDRNPSFDQAALGLGRAYFLLAQDSRAATAFELALRLNPRNFLARLALAKVYWRANLPEKAEPELAQVVQEQPEFIEAHADYGIILAKLGKYREAAAEIGRAIESGYRDAIALNYLGVAHAELGDPAQAVRDYEQALALNPRYAAACLNLALQYRKQGDAARAREYYLKVCELSDDLCRQYASRF